MHNFWHFDLIWYNIYKLFDSYVLTPFIRKSECRSSTLVHIKYSVWHTNPKKRVWPASSGLFCDTSFTKKKKKQSSNVCCMSSVSFNVSCVSNFLNQFVQLSQHTGYAANMLSIIEIIHNARNQLREKCSVVHYEVYIWYDLSHNSILALASSNVYFGEESEVTPI